MKLSIRFISIAAIVLLPCALFGTCKALSEQDLNMFSSGDIMFYDPDECAGGADSTGICGDTAREKYWSALRQHFEPVQAAGIMGNIAREGGFNPVQVESCDWLNPFDFHSGQWSYGWTWERYLTNEKSFSGSVTGVGAFGITSGREKYLQYVQETDPELLQYFEHPEKYSTSCGKGSYGLNTSGSESWGDALLAVIGDTDFNRLVAAEVAYVAERQLPSSPTFYQLDTFKSLTNAADAAQHWARYYERCAGGCLTGTGTVVLRRAAATKAYDEFKDFVCSGGSDNSSSSSLAPSADDGTTSDANITLIGDSISVMSEAELREKFPNGFLNMVGSRHPTARGACSGDFSNGGIGVLNAIIDHSPSTITTQHSNGQCATETVPSTTSNVIVWALGTNTTGATRALSQALDKIGNNRTLFLVTPYNNNGGDYTGSPKKGTDDIAQSYRDFAEQHDNVYIVDWNKAVRDNASKYLRSDGYHPSSEGSKLFADLIYQAVSGAPVCDTGEFTWYGQCDSKWASKPFKSSASDPGTVCASGCGPSSFAMMATVLLGRQITPDEVASKFGSFHVPGLGSSWGLTKAAAAEYGLEYENISSSSKSEAQAKITKYLKDGWMIHTSGGGTPPFTSGGHYIGIRGITPEGKWLLADSNGPHGSQDGEKNSTTPWNPSDVMRGMSIGNIHAIRASDASLANQNCGNMCEEEANTSDVPIEPLYETSVDVPCDPRTKDTGEIADGYYQGQLVKIRLCEVSEDGYRINGPNRVNSRVSGAFAALAHKYYTDNNADISSASAFRTMADQQRIAREYSNQKGRAATPGYSNHQMGLAIDFNTGCGFGTSPSSCTTAMSRWLGANIEQFGLSRPVSTEAWHVQP